MCFLFRPKVRGLPSFFFFFFFFFFLALCSLSLFRNLNFSPTTLRGCPSKLLQNLILNLLHLLLIEGSWVKHQMISSSYLVRKLRSPGFQVTSYKQKVRTTNRCSFPASYTAHPRTNLAENFILVNAVMGEVVSNVQSELLCRAYMYLYLGDDPFDKEAKDKFGCSSLHHL